MTIWQKSSPLDRENGQTLAGKAAKPEQST
jgi:hypothetical protein